MAAQKLPVGIDSFEKLRREGFYYVDKTGLIVDLMQNWGEVNLFTRPRRFGKTLNMSMLKCFFEIGGDTGIFDGLRISQEKELCETHMGKYPVVFVSLKGVDGLTFETAYRALCDIIRNEALRLQYLSGSDRISEEEKKSLKAILRDEYDDSDIRGSLKTLCALLEKHYGQKAILLIDEYDVPLDKAYRHGYYDRMIDVIRAMFGAALKTNDSLFFAVLTGCLRVSKESIFTGLNNLTVHSISDSRMLRCARCSMPTVWTSILTKCANGMTVIDSADRMCTVHGMWSTIAMRCARMQRRARRPTGSTPAATTWFAGSSKRRPTGRRRWRLSA